MAPELRRPALWLTLALACAVGPHARAADPGPAEPLVSVEIAGSEAATTLLKAALADAFGRLGVAAPMQGVALAKPPDVRRLEPRDPRLTARLWVDLTQLGRVMLVVVDDRHERVHVREFATGPDVDEVVLEQLALAAASSVEAVLAGQSIGMPREEYEASLQRPRLARQTIAPAAPAIAPRWARSFGSLSGAYGLGILGPGQVVHGPSVGLKLERPPFGVALNVVARLPTRVGADDLTVRLASFGFRARAFGSWPLTARFALPGGLGLGADFVQVSPRSAEPRVSLASPPFWAADGLIQGFFGVVYRTTGWTLTGLLGADVAPRSVRYVLETPAGHHDVFEPWRVRPFLELELAARLLP